MKRPRSAAPGGAQVVTSLGEHLDHWTAGDRGREPVATTLSILAATGAAMAELLAEGPLGGDFGAVLRENASGDAQKLLDVRANDMFLADLAKGPVAAVVSEESEAPITLSVSAPIAVALDPLDGSDNIDPNAPMGTVFSLLPATGPATFQTQGERQLAAGFLLYGPYTTLVLTAGQGVHVFTLDRRERTFRLTRENLRIPAGRREYAINGSNARHWPLPVRAFVEECLAGADGPRGTDYNTRWLGCVVAEAYRVLLRGGIYLYPGDGRPGYERGRLRLLYEGNPLAALIEGAGGMATDGFTRILDIVPRSPHQRVPLIFGSADKVRHVIELHGAGIPQAGQRPLFATRGLFKS